MNIKTSGISLGIIAALTAGVSEASHFRGGALVPTIANGVLTVESTTFWRPTSVSAPSATANGTSLTRTSNTTDTSDSRYTIRRQTFTRTLTAGAQTIDIRSGSCCRVAGIKNASESSWDLDSIIVWDGLTNTSPILFDLLNVQPEVLRGTAYADNLGALSGDGLALTYTSALNLNIHTAPTGLNIDPNTGQLSISAADTLDYTDNPTANVGADMAFSGTIDASNGSSVEFDWLFDGVGALSNLAPNVNDVVINALVGGTVNQTMTATDPNGDPLTWDILGFNGPGGAIPVAGIFNAATQLFTFDFTGFGVGQYIANIRASDGSLTDVGTLTINLTNPTTQPPVTPPGNNVPEPSSLALISIALFGFSFAGRRKNK